jgi:hypothetical protein
VWGSGGKVPHILNLGARLSWVVSFTPQLLYPRQKSPRYTSDRRLSGPQRRSGRGDEEEKSLHFPCRKSNPGRPARSWTIAAQERATTYCYGNKREMNSRLSVPCGRFLMQLMGLGVQMVITDICIPRRSFVSTSQSPALQLRGRPGATMFA